LQPSTNCGIIAGRELREAIGRDAALRVRVRELRSPVRAATTRGRGTGEELPRVRRQCSPSVPARGHHLQRVRLLRDRSQERLQAQEPGICKTRQALRALGKEGVLGLQQLLFSGLGRRLTRSAHLHTARARPQGSRPSSSRPAQLSSLGQASALPFGSSTTTLVPSARSPSRTLSVSSASAFSRPISFRKGPSVPSFTVNPLTL
jgi:hypothetical protein